MFSLKLELKLNNKEKTKMAQHAGFSRFVYNFGLALMRMIDHQEIKGSASKKIDMIKKLFTNYTKKQEEFAWCNGLSSRVYQNSFRDLKTAYSRHFQGIGELPVFKSKKDKQSFTVDSSNGKVLLEAGKTIKVPTLGTFRLKEAIPFSCVSQTFTISKSGDKWFISFSIDAQRLPPRIHEVVEPVGIDLGIKVFATLSDNNVVESPRPYKKAKTKLGMTQYRNRHKQLGNRKKGIKASNNAKKYYNKIRKQHYEIACVRQDFLQQTTTKLCKKYAHIKIENLNVKGMMANHKLAASIADLGMYEFKRQLTYKARWYGNRIDIVDQWYPSSKKCSNCGHKKDKLLLSDRLYVCDECGFEIDRDLNASINLEQAPDEVIIETIGMVSPKLTLVDSVSAYGAGRSKKQTL